jgi:murein L,D-transpeptidase YafK
MRTGLLAGLWLLLLFGPSLAQTTPKPLLADKIVVLKKERNLQLLSQEKVIKSYKVALGRDPVGPKTQQGDHETPEGLYVLDSRNVQSRFYKSIHISYPSDRDQQRGVSPGGDGFVHGLPNGYGRVPSGESDPCRIYLFNARYRGVLFCVFGNIPFHWSVSHVFADGLVPAE